MPLQFSHLSSLFLSIMSIFRNGALFSNIPFNSVGCYHLRTLVKSTKPKNKKKLSAALGSLCIYVVINLNIFFV
jgi:hypothetical protein